MMIKTTKKIKRVAFFGDGMAQKSDEHYQLAFETAKLLAKNNYIIVDGGGPGVMEAATLGAKEAGGEVELVVIDPQKNPENYEGINKKNESLANKIYITQNYEERMDKLVEVADAYVIFKGGSGTLSEAGLVWEMAKFEYGHQEPLIFVGKEWEAVVKSIVENMGFENKEKRVVTTVETAEEVLKALTKVES
jgi:uncharacterized protein (TIGR00725 family)